MSYMGTLAPLADSAFQLAPLIEFRVVASPALLVARLSRIRI